MLTRFSKRLQCLTLLITLGMLISACDGPPLILGARPMPQPAELATTPLPKGSQTGGLEAVYLSTASIPGVQGDRCYSLLDLYGSASQRLTQANEPGFAGCSRDGECHVPGFKILYRPSVALAGGKIEYRFQTDPGERCSLRYTYPDGSPSLAEGSGTIRADQRETCYWLQEAGDQEGKALVTVRIGEIEQDFQIELR